MTASTALATTTQPANLAEWVNAPQTLAQFREGLPATIPVDRFVRSLKDVLNASPDLRKADYRSVATAVSKAVRDGLVIDGREAALVVFKGQANYIPMVAGLRRLIYQSGMVRTLETEVVCENDEFEYEGGTAPFVKFRKQLKGERGEPYAVYSVASMKDGSVSIEVMSWGEVMKLAKDSPIWRQHKFEMARKTVLRRHYKSLPSSADRIGAFEEMDDAYVDEQGDSQSGEIATPEPTSRKQAGGAAQRLRAVQTPQPEPEEPPHDPDTGEIQDAGYEDMI